MKLIRGPLFSSTFIAIMVGCQSTIPPEVPQWEKLRMKVESGDYTLLRMGEQYYAKEVDDMFQFKDAYFWLINAMESNDPEVALAANFRFSVSGTPEGINRKDLLKWYQSTPVEQWIWTGLLWEPPQSRPSPKATAPHADG